MATFSSSLCIDSNLVVFFFLSKPILWKCIPSVSLCIRMQILIQPGDLGNIVGLPDTLKIFPVDCDQRQRLDIHNSQVTLHNRWFLPWQDALAAWSSLFKGTELKIQISECKACKRCKRYHKKVKTQIELLSTRPKKGHCCQIVYSTTDNFTNYQVLSVTTLTYIIFCSTIHPSTKLHRTC